MNLDRFLHLDKMQQAEALWNGTFLMDREDEEHRILLYQIEGFYVEVFYHKRWNAIRKIRPFDSTEQLEPYMNQISIDEIEL